jgi:hypothetical protein
MDSFYKRVKIPKEDIRQWCKRNGYSYREFRRYQHLRDFFAQDYRKTFERDNPGWTYKKNHPGRYPRYYKIKKYPRRSQARLDKLLEQVNEDIVKRWKGDVAAYYQKKIEVEERRKSGFYDSCGYGKYYSSEVKFWLKRGLCVESAQIMAGEKVSYFTYGCPATPSVVLQEEWATFNWGQRNRQQLTGAKQ